MAKAQSLQIGDLVRSYDFRPFGDRPHCYMDGVVWEIDEKRGTFTATTTKVVWQGVEDKEILEGSDVFRAPLPNILEFGEWDGRVTVLRRPRKFWEETHDPAVPSIF